MSHTELDTRVNLIALAALIEALEDAGVQAHQEAANWFRGTAGLVFGIVVSLLGVLCVSCRARVGSAGVDWCDVDILERLVVLYI